MEQQIIIFTDGSSRGNPGPGGWGAIVMFPARPRGRARTGADRSAEHNDTHVAELGGREEETTNNRMELTAAIEGLRFIESSAKLRDAEYKIVVRTDSKYLINGVTRWVAGWQKNDWRTKNKKAVLNQDLWRELVRLTEHFEVTWEYVGGHIGIGGNERADVIATEFADDKKVSLATAPLEEYPIDLTDVTHDEKALARKKMFAGKSSDKGFDKSSGKGFENGSARKNMKTYSYVSMVDGEIETHSSWDECKKRVHGKNAKFRKAVSAENEREIITEFKSVAGK
ncbi:MAG: ribonuclease H [Candidatus Paceibacterota bacterium]